MHKFEYLVLYFHHLSLSVLKMLVHCDGYSYSPVTLQHSLNCMPLYLSMSRVQGLTVLYVLFLAQLMQFYIYFFNLLSPI